MKSDTKRQTAAWIIAAIILTSFCLRAPITGVGSIIGMIKAELMLSNSGAGMLTTIPLLVFAALSVLVGKIAGGMGTGRCMLTSMIILCVGIAARSLLGSGGLYVGTVLIGTGIAAGNVLIPGIVKAYFPEKVGLLTGIYATIMSGMGGVSTGISVPIALRFGWKTALLIWLVLACAAALTWIPNRGCTTETKGGERRDDDRADSGDENFADDRADSGSKNFADDRTDSGSKKLAERHTGNMTASGVESLPGKRKSVASSPMAWAIVFYFGIQSFVFYCFIAWLPTIMQAKGFSLDTSGFFTSLFILIGIPATFIVPIISEREGDECVINVVTGLLFTVGMALILISSDPVVLTIANICAGLGVGACFSQSMALFGLRTKDARDASSLSGLSQSIGYLFAAIGPACTGWICDVTGSWTVPLIGMTLLAAAETVLGYIVGKEKIINEK